MRKPKSEFGNVGDNQHNVDFGSGHKRCNDCNFCNGIDGQREMFKDGQDPLGGFLCSQCRKHPLGEAKDFELEEWYLAAVEGHDNNVDGSNTYDEMVENLVDKWGKD